MDDDAPDNHRNAPRPSASCLYGLVGEIARAGGETTEANPYAIAANAMAYLSCAVGRGPYMPVGNTWHHARLFTMHVGRSGEGRKGDSVSIIKRIAHAVQDMNGELAPQIHTGGLSSREGLVFLIHDGYREGKEEVPPILDKRLLVIESEFVNILTQGKRDGNTLSSALRDAWDGGSLRPATKTNRLWASHPHICLSVAITPSELMSSIAAKDLTNGFMNRFMPFWAERTKMLPFPKATPKDEIERLAGRVLEVLQFCQADRWAERDTMRIELSPGAAARWRKLYLGELNDRSNGERINALIERRAPMLLRIAMLFALCDLTTTVEVDHIDAALAWVRYSVESVKFVFGSAADEAEVAETNDTAAKIVAFLEANTRVTRKQITVNCFRGHVNKTRIDAALDELLTATPPRIVVEEDRSGPGRPTKFYELSANKANYANNKQRRAVQADSGPGEESERSEQKPIGTEVSSQVRIVSEEQKPPGDRAHAQCSPSSHSSPADEENAEARL
ncbi:DUF3987 domain-containing protein [Hydrogenophaga sp. BPS33]|nr:DUF3987 domain-containing protein [Hydrogenophaga sp. BPS33]